MKKKLGIIETLKAAKTEKEVVELTKKISEFDQVSDKTVRKFSKIQRKKRAQLRKKDISFEGKQLRKKDGRKSWRIEQLCLKQ